MSANGWTSVIRFPAASISGIRRLSLYSALGGLALLLGLVRELLVASNFGLSPELDAYVAVLGFQLLFGVQVGNALNNAFVSQVGRLERSRIRAHLNAALRGLILVNVVLATVLMAFSGEILGWIFPSFSLDQQALAARITGFMVMSITLANMSGLLRGGLELLGDFSPGFLSGSIISICSIASLLLFSDALGIESLVLGLLLGNLLVFALYASGLRAQDALSLKPDATWTQPRTFHLWGAAAVVLIGEVLYQTQAMTERSFASSLGTGTISSFFYASALTLVPLSLFVLPLVTTLFPRLTAVLDADRREGVRLLASWGTLLALAGCLAALLLIGFAEPLVQIVFMRGRFSAEDARRTAEILPVLAMALPFLCVARLVRYGFYALGAYRMPLYGYLASLLALVVLGTGLLPSLGARGLAIASVAAQALGTSLMVFLLVLRLRHA